MSSEPGRSSRGHDRRQGVHGAADPYASVFAAAGAHAAEATLRFLGMPFFRDGIRLRTRFLDDSVRDGLAAGLDQVVLLGAGFDARGLRMREIEARRAMVFEVDTPYQMDRKQRALAGAGVTRASTRGLRSVRFRKPRSGG